MTTWRWLPFDALGGRELYDLLALRQAVFVVEQDCPYLDADGRDLRARHLLGARGDELVACLRAFAPGQLRPEAVIGRVVTAPWVRGEGVGTELMEVGLARVWDTWGPCPVFASCQAHLRGWYGRLGFAVTGAGYDEDGIPHLPMTHPGPR
jgi:ElaA protein